MGILGELRTVHKDKYVVIYLRKSTTRNHHSQS